MWRGPYHTGTAAGKSLCLELSGSASQLQGHSRWLWRHVTPSVSHGPGHGGCVSASMRSFGPDGYATESGMVLTSITVRTGDRLLGAALIRWAGIVNSVL
jgi:hypothetical protein